MSSNDGSKKKKKDSNSGCDGCDIGLLGCLAFEGCNLLAVLLAAMLAVIASPQRTVQGFQREPGMSRSVAFGLGLIHWYKEQISTRTRARCLYQETCSTYGLRMLRQHGLLRGSAKTLRRITSCRPGTATA